MSTTHGLNGLRALVTGGTSGLGLALVQQLLDAGASVAFVARTRERVEAIACAYPSAHGIVGDVARKDDIYPIALQVVAGPAGRPPLITKPSPPGPGPLGPAPGPHIVKPVPPPPPKLPPPVHLVKGPPRTAR